METMHPLVLSQLFQLVPPPSVTLMSYLYNAMDYGGHLAQDQPAMAKDLGVSQQTISNRIAPLCSLNVVLQTDPKRRPIQYSVHPLAAKYENAAAMETAIAQALEDIRAGRLPKLLIPMYQALPPNPDRQRPDLRVAS